MMNIAKATANPPPGSTQVTLIVGENWPLSPMEDGSRLDLVFREGGLGLDLILTIGHPAPSTREVVAYRHARIVTSILIADPLVWLLFDIGGMLFEAVIPNGTVEGSPAALKESLKVADKRILLALVDDGILIEMRPINVGPSWWNALEYAAQACSRAVSNGDIENAIERDQSRWTLPEMFRRGACNQS